MIKSAAIVGAGRTLGLNDDEAISVKNFTNEREAQRARAEEAKRIRAMSAEQKAALFREFEGKLAEAGIPSMDEADVKSDSQVLRDVGDDFGYSDYEQFQQAQREKAEVGKLYEKLDDAKQKLRRELKRNPNSKKAEYLSRTVMMLEDRAKDFGFGMMDFAQEGEPTGEARDAIIERERARRMSIGGKSELTSRGRVIQSVQDLPVQINGGLTNSTLNQLRDGENQRQRYRDFIAGQAAAADVDRRFRGDLTDAEIEGQARRAAMAIEYPDAPFKAQVQPKGPLGTEAPAVMDPARMEQKVIVPGSPSQGNDRGRSAVIGLTFPAAEEGITWRYEQVPGSNVPNKVLIQPEGEGSLTSDARRVPVRNTPGVNTVTPESAADAVLSELRSRRMKGIQGGVEARRAANDLQARIDASNQLHSPGAFYGRANVAAVPRLASLGKALGVGADMGVKLGDQRKDFGDAYRVERPDGSYEYVDADGELLGDLSYNSRPMPNEASSAEMLNAPIGGETAESFIKRLQYDNYGASSFGDESVIGNLAEVGKSGGGIPQVNIGGALSGLEAAVAKELGMETPRTIRNAEALQNAANAVFAAGKAKGTKFFNMVDGKKTIVENPGMQELFWQLKIPPAQQKEIANALFQLEASYNQGVNLDRKKGYFEGGRFGSPVVRGKREVALQPGIGPVNLNAGQRSFVVNAGAGQGNQRIIRFGLPNPARGGEDARIGKAPASVQAKLRKNLQGDAAKPFVGQVEGDPARVGDIQQYKGMDPVEVRIYQEGVQRANAEKKAKRKGLRFISKSKKDQIADVATIRRMQEGNVMAGLRKDRADAQAAAQPSNEGGRIVPGTPVPTMLRPGAVGQLSRRVGYGNERVELLPKPQRKYGFGEAPTEQGPNVQVPANFRSKRARAGATGLGNPFLKALAEKQLKRRADIERGGVAALGAGGAAAILAGILGTRNPEEEEQY